MSKGKQQAPAKVMSAGNRPNGKAWKKFIKTLVFDERKNRYKMKRVPNPKAK
jgi:hypothetical protein